MRWSGWIDGLVVDGLVGVGIVDGDDDQHHHSIVQQSYFDPSHQSQTHLHPHPAPPALGSDHERTGPGLDCLGLGLGRECWGQFVQSGKIAQPLTNHSMTLCSPSHSPSHSPLTQLVLMMRMGLGQLVYVGSRWY